jgi:hypothetical protein
MQISVYDTVCRISGFWVIAFGKIPRTPYTFLLAVRIDVSYGMAHVISGTLISETLD